METKDNTRHLLADLRRPFAVSELEFRVGQVSKKGDKATVLAYLTSRAVMDRLDDVVGPENWCDEYREAPQGGLMCGLSIRVDGQWVTKYDGAENTQIEGVKGGFSGALKRAAVKWGIGRYLYFLDSRYLPIRDGWANGPLDVNVTQRGKGMLGHVSVPMLPAWALPGGAGRPETSEPAGPAKKARRKAKPKTPKTPKTQTAPQPEEPLEQPPQTELTPLRKEIVDPGSWGWFCARINEITGLRVDDVSAWLESKGRDRASQLPESKRSALVQYFEDHPEGVEALNDFTSARLFAAQGA